MSNKEKKIESDLKSKSMATTKKLSKPDQTILVCPDVYASRGVFEMPPNDSIST
jgi:hypothetical protein